MSMRLIRNLALAVITAGSIAACGTTTVVVVPTVPINSPTFIPEPFTAKQASDDHVRAQCDHIGGILGGSRAEPKCFAGGYTYSLNSDGGFAGE